MKTLALAALAAIGLSLTAGTADAQVRFRRGNSYTTSSGTTYYSYPSSIYPTATYPSTSYSYSSVTPGFTYSYPSYGSSVTSYYSPYSAGSVVAPAGYSPAYGYSNYSTYPTYSGYSTYPSYYSTPYNGTYITPAGGMIRGRSFRW